MAAFMETIRKGIESLSVLPNDLTAKIEESIDEMERRFEKRMHSNLAGLFSGTGMPAPEKLDEIKEVLDRLETRLESIESNVKALEEHPKDQPWPTEGSKSKRRKRS